MAHPADKYANATQPWMRYQPRRDTLTAYKPTMAQRIPDMVKDGLRALGLNKFAANAFGTPIADVLGYSPVGAVAQSWDAGQAAARADGAGGKALGLGGGMALAALGAVPGGKALRGVAEREALDFATKGYKEARLGNTVVGYTVNPDNRAVEINTVKTPAAMRGQGSARAAMNDVISAADSAGYQLHLTPDPMDAATSKSKLTAFYKSLGFAQNAGKSRDFSTRAAMVRAPDLPALAMDEASRMARAREMGFDTATPLYHGTGTDFSAFKRDKESWGRYGQGLYLTNTPHVAHEYAHYAGEKTGEGARIMPVMQGMKNPLVIEQAEFGSPPYRDEYSHETLQRHGLPWGSMRKGDTSADITKQARARGHDGIIVKHRDGRDEYVVFDPANIRSRFAAFDPAKRGSSDLLAGLGLGGLGYGLMSGTNWSDPTQY